MFWFYLLISHKPPYTPPTPTSELPGCCLLGSEAEWGGFGTTTPPFFFFLKNMFMHQISAISSPRQGRCSVLDWCSRAAPPPLRALAPRKKGDDGERKRALGNPERRGNDSSDFQHRLCCPGRLFRCVCDCFWVHLWKTREWEIVLSTAWGWCSAYMFKPCDVPCSTITPTSFNLILSFFSFFFFLN